MSQNTNNLAAYIWSLADLLRGDFKQSQYARIILPFILLRRIECVLEDTKEAVLTEYEKAQKMDLSEEAQEKLLLRASGVAFFNTSKMDLSKLGKSSIESNLTSYVQGFSNDVREIFENFYFFNIIEQLSNAKVLNEYVQKICQLDFRPVTISNHEIGLVFEELIRRLAESVEVSGELFTPRDVVQLMASLVFDDISTKKINSRCTIYDPAVGTGGFLSEGIEYFKKRHAQVDVQGYGQDLNADSYAICKASMLIKGHSIDNIKLGNSLSHDQFQNNKFDYMLSSPPFGLAWKNIEEDIRDEHDRKGFDGRFGPGLPRVSDGSLLFLLHLIRKLKDPNDGGGRIGIVLNSSALVTGGAGSGESEIRRYILEEDLLETVVALPKDMFYNTGIATYICVLSNKKDEKKRNKVQIIDSLNRTSESAILYGEIRIALGSKQNVMNDKDISAISKSSSLFEVDETCNSLIYDIKDFGFRRITIERPLRLQFIVTAESLTDYQDAKGMKYYDQFSNLEGKGVYDCFTSFISAAKVKNLNKTTLKPIMNCFSVRHPQAEIFKDSNGASVPDKELRRFENIPLDMDVHDYFKSEILPYFTDAWIDENILDKKDGEVGVVGYELNINRIRLNTQMEKLETQYNNYTVTNLGRLALKYNKADSTGGFEEHENAIYIRKNGMPKVLENLNEIKNFHNNYLQIVLDSSAINKYVVAFFKSTLGVMALKTAIYGGLMPSLRIDELDKVTVALPDFEEQKNIVSTLKKLSMLKDAIGVFDSELALNPTSSKSILTQLDDMLNTIGGLTEADSIRGMLRMGESETIEFKSTLSLDLKTNKKESHIETSVFKTVVAFLNSNGGTLLVGVSDDGLTLGIELEIEKFYKNNKDKYLLHWKNKLKSRIGEQYYPFIKASIVDVDGKYLLKIDCQQSTRPCYLDNKDFYVRTNPATDKLEGPKLVEYVSNHFSA